MVGAPSGVEDRDRFGFEETSDWMRKALGRFVPQALATRAIAVSVATDRAAIAPGEPVRVSVAFRNRLPVPVTLVTPKRRLWGWTVDGEAVRARDREVTRDAPGAFVFRARERKTVTRHWRGRFEHRTDGTTRWVDADQGDHEITAFVATRQREPRASTTVRVTE